MYVHIMLYHNIRHRAEYPWQQTMPLPPLSFKRGWLNKWKMRNKRIHARTHANARTAWHTQTQAHDHFYIYLVRTLHTLVFGHWEYFHRFLTRNVPIGNYRFQNERESRKLSLFHAQIKCENRYSSAVICYCRPVNLRLSCSSKCKKNDTKWSKSPRLLSGACTSTFTGTRQMGKFTATPSHAYTAHNIVHDHFPEEKVALGFQAMLLGPKYVHNAHAYSHTHTNRQRRRRQ